MKFKTMFPNWNIGKKQVKPDPAPPNDFLCPPNENCTPPSEDCAPKKLTGLGPLGANRGRNLRIFVIYMTLLG